MSRATRAAVFGYAYRELIEEELAADAEPAGHALSIDDALVFAAAAAISGVIGNVAYDLIKAAVVRILDRAHKKGTPNEPDATSADVLIRYVQEYQLYGLSRLPREVANRVVTEMFIDEQIQLRHFAEGSQLTAAQIEAEARQRVAKELLRDEHANPRLPQPKTVLRRPERPRTKRRRKKPGA